MSGIRFTKRVVALLGMCLAVASVTAAQARTNEPSGISAKADAATTLTVENGNLMLDGQRFFMVAAEAFSACPTPEVVNDYLALGVNTIIHWQWPCPSVSNIDATWMHGLLRGRLWWLELGPAPNEHLEGLPELMEIQGPFTIQPNPARFYSCGSHLNTSTDIFDRFRQWGTGNRAMIYNTVLANPIGPNYPNCMTSRAISNVLWTVVAAGGDGLEITSQVPLQPNTPGSVDENIQTTLVTQLHRLNNLACVMKGQPVSVKQGSGGLRLGAWRYGGKTCLVAVNTKSVAANARIKLPAMAKGSAKVMWENRSERPARGVISDSFASLAVHVYMTG